MSTNLTLHRFMSTFWGTANNISSQRIKNQIVSIQIIHHKIFKSHYTGCAVNQPLKFYKNWSVNGFSVGYPLDALSLNNVIFEKKSCPLSDRDIREQSGDREHAASMALKQRWITHTGAGGRRGKIRERGPRRRPEDPKETTAKYKKHHSFETLWRWGWQGY